MTLVLVARTCRRSPRARDGAVCAPHGARRTHLQTELETRIVARKQRIRQRLGHRRGAGRRAERDLPALRASALRRGRSGFRAVGRAPRRRRRRDLEAPGPRGHGRERAAFPRFRPCLSRGLGAGRDNYAMPWPVTEALLLKFVAHHLWDPARRESDARHGMPAEVADQLREDGFLRADGPHAPGTVRRRLSAPPTVQSRPALPRPRRPRRSGSAPALPVASAWRDQDDERRRSPCAENSRGSRPAAAQRRSRIKFTDWGRRRLVFDGAPPVDRPEHRTPPDVGPLDPEF